MIKRILVVDDAFEVRRLLRAGIETLGPAYLVVDLPSAEEALLELARQPVDLLITDIRLAGMNGLELKQKIKARYPKLKVILITGMTDPEIKRQAVEAGADAFFLKPVVMAEFLDTVDRCLDLAKPAPAAPASAGTKPSTGGLAERIASLRQELHAISAILLDERGRISVQAGDFPDAGIEATLFPALMGNFSIGEKISLLLGTTTPEDLFCYTGAKYDLFMSHVGPSYALLVMVSKAPRNESPGTIGVTIQKAAQELLSILTDLGVTPTIPEAVPAPPESETITEARLPELDNLFRLKRKKSLKPEEVDAFWDTLAENTTGEDVISTEALSYEQARRLGLLPDETAPEEPTD